MEDPHSDEKEAESSHPHQVSRPVREVRENTRYKTMQEQSLPSRSHQRRKIYNDVEFQEVVSNFYDLITEINKQFKENKKGNRRIQKKPTNFDKVQFKRFKFYKVQFQRSKKIKTNAPDQQVEHERIPEDKLKRQDFTRYKGSSKTNEIQSSSFWNNQTSGFDPSCINSYFISFYLKVLEMMMNPAQKTQGLASLIQSGNPYATNIPSMMMNQSILPAPFQFEPQVYQNYRQPERNITEVRKREGMKKFGRNAYHVAIAYHIYMTKVSQNKQANEIVNIENNYDPTFQARKIRDINKRTPHQEGKKSEELIAGEMTLESPQKAPNTILYHEHEEMSGLDEQEIKEDIAHLEGSERNLVMSDERQFSFN